MELKTVLLIANCSNFSATIPLVLGLLQLRKRHSGERLLLILITVALLTDTTSFILVYFFKSNAGFLSSVYRVLEFIFLALMYRSYFSNRWQKTAMLSLIYFFVGLQVVGLFLTHSDIVKSYSTVFSSITFITLSIAFFFKLMKDLPTLHLQRLAMFWINTAILVYFSGNFFLFLMNDYLVNVMHDNLMVYWSFHNMLNIIKNLLFAIAFWQGIRKAGPNSD
jgi:hypothetical protein